MGQVAARLLAITHQAQWRAVQDHAADKGVALKDADSIRPELEVAAASAGTTAGAGLLAEGW